MSKKMITENDNKKSPALQNDRLKKQPTGQI